MNGVTVCALSEVAGNRPVGLKDGAGACTASRIEEEFVAKIHRVESIALEDSESVHSDAINLDAAMRAKRVRSK